MTQVVAQNPYTLESSIQLTRPDLKTFFQPDTNAGGTNIHQFVENERLRKLHIPSAAGPPDFTQTCCPSNTNEVPIEGTELLAARKPYELALVDPLNGFLSPAGEVLLNTGRTRMRTMGKQKKEPQNVVPSESHSIRDYSEAIDEIKRGAEGKEDPVLKWNSRKVPDAILRARLGGWTSDFRKEKTDPSIVHHKIEEVFPNMKASLTVDQRDQLAKKFQWTSSTQSAYEEVHWDRKLPPRLHAPNTTFESYKADPVMKTEEPPKRPQIWQTVAGKAWDRLQERKNNFTKERVDFTSQTKRGHQIPGYGGYIGGYNIEGIDDVNEKFEPYTVVRTEQPKLPDPNFKANIPGYTGHMHNFKTTTVSHNDKEGRPYTTYSAYHRKLATVDQNHPKIPSLSGDFAAISTKVPPMVPYNIIDKVADPDTNHSLDHVLHPAVNPKKSNYTEYLPDRRERELKKLNTTNN